MKDNRRYIGMYGDAADSQNHYRVIPGRHQLFDGAFQPHARARDEDRTGFPGHRLHTREPVASLGGQHARGVVMGFAQHADPQIGHILQLRPRL